MNFLFLITNQRNKSCTLERSGTTSSAHLESNEKIWLTLFCFLFFHFPVYMASLVATILDPIIYIVVGRADK